jgi:glyoxylase-like metal-dependent hydrolase (beta-lactamase superfamily II)
MRLGKSGVCVYFPQPTGDVCSNTIVIEGKEKIIVDPGLRHLFRYLEQSILEETKISPEDFSYVIHTHSHPDHMGAGSLLEDKYGVVQAMSAEEKEFLEGPGGQGLFQWFGLDPPSGTIGKILEEGPLELEDKTLMIYLTPGHSPGSICIHWPEEKILITGDLIFSGSFGRVDLAGGDPRELCVSIKRMAALESVDMIIPGHGPAIVGRSQVEKNYKDIFSILSRSGFM